jgi:hypothetical protein
MNKMLKQVIAGESSDYDDEGLDQSFHSSDSEVKKQKSKKEKKNKKDKKEKKEKKDKKSKKRAREASEEMPEEDGFKITMTKR